MIDEWMKETVLALYLQNFDQCKNGEGDKNTLSYKSVSILESTVAWGYKIHV